MKVLSKTMSSLLLLLAALAAGSCKAPAAQTPTPSPAPVTAPSVSSEANRLLLESLPEGKPFAVNGVEISKAELDRSLVYLVGSQLIQRKIVQFLCEEELQSRMSAGADPASFKVLGDEVEKKIAETKAQFATEHPDVDFGKNLQASGYTETSLREHVATSLVFEKLFFPNNPKDWPEITKEILRSKGGAAMLDSFLKEGEGEGKPPEMPPILKASFAQQILQELTKASNIQYAGDGLGPDLVFTLNGRPFRTKEAMERLAEEIRPAHRAQNRVWAAIGAAVRQDLEAQKHWLDAASVRQRWSQLEGKYVNSFIPLEAVVVTIKRFPTMEIYKSYFHMLESFRTKIANEITEENLQKHLAFARDFLGSGSVQAHILLASAWDFATNSPRPFEDWEAARKKAEMIKKQLDEGADFEKLLDEHSGYPEKNPNPQTPAKQQWNKGRFASLSKYELKNMIGENEFDSFLRGHSIADEVFVPGREGLLGPLQGAYGYYLVKIVNRMAGTRTIDLKNPNQRELLEEDYVTTRFLTYANEIFAKAKIEAKP